VAEPNPVGINWQAGTDLYLGATPTRLGAIPDLWPVTSPLLAPLERTLTTLAGLGRVPILRTRVHASQRMPTPPGTRRQALTPHIGRHLRPADDDDPGAVKNTAMDHDVPEIG